jgi:glycogen operon protein
MSGTPMLLMGDEMRHTQRGNNNAYCQDKEVSRLDWSLPDRRRDLDRCAQRLIAQRRRGIAIEGEVSFGSSLNELLRRAEIHWHGIRLGQPDWTDIASRPVAALLLRN